MKLVLSISIVVTIISLSSAYLNWNNQFIIVSLLFYFAQIYLNKKSSLNNWKTLVVLNTPFFLIYSVPIYMNELDHVYPITIFPIISSLIAVITTNSNKKILVIYTGIIICFGLFIMPNWINHTLVIKNNKIKSLNLKKLDFFDKKNNEITLPQNKILVLDFWSNTCKPCIEAFPKFEKLKTRWKDKNIEFITINIPIPPYETQYEYLSRTKHYSFKTIKTNKSALEKLQLNILPLYMIIDTKGNISFMSNQFIEDKWYIVNSIQDNISRIYNEQN